MYQRYGIRELSRVRAYPRTTKDDLEMAEVSSIDKYLRPNKYILITGVFGKKGPITDIAHWDVYFVALHVDEKGSEAKLLSSSTATPKRIRKAP